MIKELKFFFFLVITIIFIFFSLKYYFSDENYKNSYRSISQLDEKIKQSENNLILLKNDTENIIEFVEYKNNKNTKNFSFWDLIYKNE